MVGIADYRIASGPYRIITVGLGSCVGISIYDTFSMTGGLAHIMLPESTQFQRIDNEAKFADLAIPKMIFELESLGVKRRNMAAKIAGGASMFQFADKGLNADIGQRNVEAVRSALRKLGIPVLAEDTGGNTGRTMILDLETKNVYVRLAGKEPKLL